VPGHEVLGAQPGLALFRLDQSSGALSPALLTALNLTIRQAFSHVFMVAAVLSALALIGAFALKEIPLRGGEEPREKKKTAAAD